MAEEDSACTTTGATSADGVPSGVSSDDLLNLAVELTERGTKTLNESDYGEAADCFSRALEIRVSHYDELSLECLSAYYQYGRALLYKAQEEADPLATVPKKDSDSKQESDKGSVRNECKADISTAFADSSNTEEDGKSDCIHQGEADDASGQKDQEEDDEESDDEDLAEADEDESDLDLAWKMLDVARAIAEKHSGDTMEKVDVLSALAEVSLEREDIETSLSDYRKALLILERIVESDDRHLAELNFRICLCLELGSKPQEAISYCQKALLICKSRLQRLMNEAKGSSESTISSAVSESDDSVQPSINGSQNGKSVTDKEAEIGTLTDLSGELEKKLEDLQQQAVNPKSILSEILGMAFTKANGSTKNASSAEMNAPDVAPAGSNGAFGYPTASTVHTNGAAVTNLGVVGRGVKRVLTTTTSAGSAPVKKPASNPSAQKEDDNAH